MALEIDDLDAAHEAHQQRLKTAFQEVQAILPATAGEERLRLLGQAGNLARQLGAFQEARDYFQRAVDAAQAQGRPRFEVPNRIRLGIACFEAQDYVAAEGHYRAALEQISVTPEVEDYRDFVLFQVGRLLVEQGLLDEARQTFESVLILRQQKGNAELMASAREALLAVRELQDEASEAAD